MIDWKEKNKKLADKLDKVNEETRRIIDKETERLVNELDASEDLILQAFERSANDKRYREKYIESSPQLKQKFLKEVEELDKHIDFLTHRKYAIKEELDLIVRDEIINSKMLGTIPWEINTGWTDEERIYINADLNANKKIYDLLMDPFSFNYHWSYTIYTFPDGRTIKMGCNDSELNIDLNDDKISPEEYQVAFKQLGIKINFDKLESNVLKLESKKLRLKKIIELFKI